MSISWHLDAEPSPRILVLPPAAASLDEAHAAIELWEHYKRRQLDPTQRLVVEVMMATDAAGTWAAPTTGREMPRQNGKGDEVEVVELWGLVQRAERILHTVHDAVLLATETQSRLLSVIEGHPDLRRLKLRAWRGTGQQMIEMRNGGIIWYRTRTGGGARGVDEVDRVVVDEAQHAEEEHLAAITPTQLASANPQLNALGTAGISGKSAWWWRQRKRALTDRPGDFGYIGHTAETLTLDAEGKVSQTAVDVEDRSKWWETNPALGRPGGPTEAFFAEQLLRLGPELFGREHLGVWDPEPGTSGSAVPMNAWVAARDPQHKPSGRLAYALDVSPEGRSTAIAASDGQHGEIVKHAPGTSWVVSACIDKRDVFSEMVLDPAGPAGALVAPLEAAGITVRQVTTREAVQAAGGFLADLVDGKFHHIGQPELDAAAANADRRQVGDGGWLFSRIRSTVDIAPLVAVTLARWAAGNKQAPTVGFVTLDDFLDDDDL